ncbi:MAG: hypothetical protein NMK33_04025 [Candidatus Cardinium sp.]|uniref:RING finger domain-containing protein n=1 Tax=Cardinium endosymbiont of Dermatophagoides farinae TaxID=2597823 RepID=UPI0011844E81|nr:RING finger domain-containing protein [Cardinium endosymbiont of Dermatophagoides farinae]TSJ80606.1 hypothetical protein FPG78_00750 [Cardinium endosymbiont of Dermatophagoides farinae]UWW96599.1 MAG: hypothetical protein NMK33_04025 [Candidatus Cardinium sp.]
MIFKIKSRLVVALCYLFILALVLWFGFNKKQSIPTRGAQIEQILAKMEARKPEAQHNPTVPQEGTCSICFEKATHWLPCGHYFHVNCIAKWLNTAMSCPNCRRHPLE